MEIALLALPGIVHGGFLHHHDQYYRPIWLGKIQIASCANLRILRNKLKPLDAGHLSDILEPVVYSSAWVEAHRAERTQRREQISALPDQWFEGLIGLLDSAHSLCIRDELERVRCPTLVIAAELDSFVPLERARGLAEAIGGASFKIIEGAGHAVVVEQPKRVVDLCLEFLRTVDAVDG